MTFLLADSGSTKTDWLLTDGKEKLLQLRTPGINAALMSREQVSSILLGELLPQLPAGEIREVYYYGAGCLTDETNGNVEYVLRQCFPNVRRLEIASDRLGAARALCGRNGGIACILGTGLGTCFYDGSLIADYIPSMGYILGDEGSGASLGKHLLRNIFKRLVPEALERKFFQEYGFTYASVVEKVYREPEANRFLASLSPFILQNLDDPSMHRLVLEEFREFFQRNVLQLSQGREYPCNIIGSIAVLYRPILQEAADEVGVQLGIIAKSPLDGLMKYHAPDTPSAL